MNHTNCQFRDKHTVGGIVFYKHAFLVSNKKSVGAVILTEPDVMYYFRYLEMLGIIPNFISVNVMNKLSWSFQATQS